MLYGACGIYGRRGHPKQARVSFVTFQECPSYPVTRRPIMIFLVSRFFQLSENIALAWLARM